MLDFLIILILLLFFLNWAMKQKEIYEYEKSIFLKNENIKKKISKMEININNFSIQNDLQPVQYERLWHYKNIPTKALTEEDIKALMSVKYLAGPYGMKLIKHIDITTLPVIPSELLTIDNSNFTEKIKILQKRINNIHLQLTKEKNRINKLKSTYNLGQKTTIEELAKLTLIKHSIPKLLQKNITATFQTDNRTILIVIETHDLSSISIVKHKEKRFHDEWIELSTKNQKKLKEDLLYSLCIRASYLVAKSDLNNYIDVIAVNIKQNWFDPATGASREGVIASFQGLKKEFESLQIDKIEPRACFRYFKGISTPSIENIMTIKPIFDLNTNDKRIIKNKNVSDFLDPNANLAQMPWDDFEHLVRQFFEWEYSNKGFDVKITCASRDRGVDAIMFNSDPLTGGKYVLQAKRYNRTVDVAAVRDLYGTVINEGANRGILVTTSSYGPDTYEFAKDKPISLVDGQHLIKMLQKHGKNYHITLEK